MQINNNRNYTPNFQAKFLHSESLKQIADYAVELGKFDKLNNARKNIDSAFLRTRIRVDFGADENNKSFVTFTRFVPKENVVVPQTMDDYIVEKTMLYTTTNKKKHPLKYALEKIIKMGNQVPENRIFREVVIKK